MCSNSKNKFCCFFRYDPNNSGTVNGAQFLNALGIQMENGEERQASPQLISGKTRGPDL